MIFPHKEDPTVMQTTLKKQTKKTLDKKVSDMAVKKLKELIRGVVREIVDPDYGLELRPEVEAELKASLGRIRAISRVTS